VPAQSDDQRQLPLEPLVQDDLEQHLTSDASAGQAPLMVMPPDEVQVDVVTQTPVDC